jgi:hypothetical protein
VHQKGHETFNEFSAGRKILFLAHPTLWPSRQSRQYGKSAAGVDGGELGFVFIFVSIPDSSCAFPEF